MRRLPTVIAALALISGHFASAEVQHKTVKINGTTVEYVVVLPDHYDPAKAYPGVLAFGGGPQTMNVVEGMIKRQFQSEAEKRGYIVVSPAAPGGRLFFEGGEKIFPAFLTRILADYKIENNKFHMAGRSNGGISAFHVAASHPEYFLSITGFPGYLPDASAARLKAISKMCIYMHVGELDSGWRQDMLEQSDAFRKQGMSVQFTVEKGQHHSIETLAGAGSARLFDHFDQARQGCAK
jgi:poly(3-hydroxybutyrate) depolymerase